MPVPFFIGLGIMPSKSIFLIGFMGAGKSTVGRILASRLTWKVIDLDQAIEKHASMAIPQIFDREGEEGFRRLETETLRRVANDSCLVVATGGGIVERSLNWELMRQGGQTVFLDVPWTALLDRLRNKTGRPLADERKPEDIKKLFLRRRPLYRQADLVIPCGGHSPEDIADLILEQI